MKKKVLIPTKLDAVAAELLAAHGGYDVVQDAKTPLADLVSANPDTYALIVRSEQVTPEVIDALPSLKVVIRAGAGYNTIDIKYARKKGVDVMNTPGANANGVAEEVVALMLADARHIVAADPSTRAGLWEKSKFMGKEVTGKTVGIVGLGNIGRLVAKRLEGFECRLLGYDPLVPADSAQKFGIESTTLEATFQQCDYVTLHIPENAETRGLVGTRLLGMMKKGATLVNCARAGIVDEAALRAAKAEKGIRYLNDVYPKDAEGPKSIADVADIMMPHLGASTREANETAARRAAQQLIDLDDKGVTSFIVNRDIPEGLNPGFCTLAYTLSALARGLLGKDQPIAKIETTFYGQLAKYSKWLLLSMLNGIWEDIDRSTNVDHALEQLKSRGVEYSDRVMDPAKHYDNSLTVDLLTDRKGGAQRVSVRGTMAEGHCMVSRINQFDRLYWVPQGNAVFFQYKDRPGVIATISRRIAAAGINIEDMRNPHDDKTGESLAILSLNTPVSNDLVRSIADEIQAVVAQSVQL